MDNQMFDLDGNILTSLKNSFNQSMLCGSVNSRLNSEQTMGGNQFGMGGPQAHISPVANLRKNAPADDSIKPTSSSQGPSCRLQSTISPTNQHLNNGSNNRQNNNNNNSRSSRNSGFKPL